VDCTVVLTVLDIGVEVHQLIQDVEEIVSWVQNSQYPAYTVSVTDSDGFTSNITFTPESVSEVDSLTGEVIATWDILVCCFLFIYLHFYLNILTHCLRLLGTFGTMGSEYSCHPICSEHFICPQLQQFSCQRSQHQVCKVQHIAQATPLHSQALTPPNLISL